MVKCYYCSKIKRDMYEIIDRGNKNIVPICKSCLSKTHWIPLNKIKGEPL